MAKKKAKDNTGSMEEFDKYIYPIENFKCPDDVLEKAILCISYWREFPHVFAEQYLGLRLKNFQTVALTEMMHRNSLALIECRNLGKTWLTAVFICIRCILYPKTKVIICAAQRSQSAETITKIKEIMMESPALRAEVSELSESVNSPHCIFCNGSTCRIVTMSEASRSKRANLIIVDEFAFGFDHDILQNVITNFLGNPRNPSYLNDKIYYLDETCEHLKPEWEWLKESDKEIYLSSAGFKSSWQYTTFMDFYNKMINGEEGFFACNIQYMSAIKCGLRSKKFYIAQMQKEGFNQMKGMAEYRGVWMQSSDSAFFPYESLDNIRKLRKAIYPKELNEFIMDKNKKYLNPKKPEGCLRVMGCDIALRRGSKNDASAYVIMQLIPKEKTIVSTDENGNKAKIKIPYYERQLIYIETNNGWLIEKQVERIKKLYHDFDCDRIIIDSKSGGLGLVQELSKPTIDNTTGEDYPPFQSYNDEEMAEWCTYPMPLKTMYCMQATADTNKTMAEGLQKVINNGSLQLLISENQVKDQLQLIKGYDEFPQTTRNKIELPYFETRLLIEEMSALELVSTVPFKLKEPNGGRKDRWSALLYCNGLADMLEAEMAKPKRKKSKGIFKYVPQEHFVRNNRYI